MYILLIPQSQFSNSLSSFNANYFGYSNYHASRAVASVFMAIRQSYSLAASMAYSGNSVYRLPYNDLHADAQPASRQSVAALFTVISLSERDCRARQTHGYQNSPAFIIHPEGHDKLLFQYLQRPSGSSAQPILAGVFVTAELLLRSCASMAP